LCASGRAAGNETFEAAMLGTAEEVCEERVSDDAMIMIK
jgi:hypothetical protein